jgi:hypothetical protein
MIGDRTPYVPGLDISGLGGAGGIRTLDRALQPYNGLANRRLQPLGHSSVSADMPDARASRKRQIQITPRPFRGTGASRVRGAVAAGVRGLARQERRSTAHRPRGWRNHRVAALVGHPGVPAPNASK